VRRRVDVAWIAGALLALAWLPGLADSTGVGGVTKLGPLPALEEPDPEMADLGKLLFFDVRLSGDASLACASCHKPEFGWADGEELSLAYPGSKYFRNTQSIMNMAHKRYFYWDGRLTGKDADTQVRDKITETHFMNLDGRLMLERLKQVPEYVEMFHDVFGDEPSFGRTLKAIAAFERTLVSRNVPFDDGRMTDEARRGLDLFQGKAACVTCHNGSMFSDFRPHRTGVGDHPKLLTDPERVTTFRSMMKFLGVPNFENLASDPGFYTVSKQRSDIGKFMTPSLREVGRTAPYMHNGTFWTLEEVVDFYDRGGGDGAELKPLGLTSQDKSDLVAFLQSLSGDELIVEAPDLPTYRVIENWLEVPN